MRLILYKYKWVEPAKAGWSLQKLGGALELAGLTSVSDMPLSSAGMEAWVIVALHWETWLSAVQWYVLQDVSNSLRMDGKAPKISASVKI